MLAGSVNVSVVGRIFAIALVVVLLGMCVAEVVHAAMPHDELDCPTRLCDGHRGCVPAGTVMLQGVPVATVPAPTGMAAGAESVMAATVIVAPSPPPQGPLLPSAPRSPPLV